MRLFACGRIPLAKRGPMKRLDMLLNDRDRRLVLVVEDNDINREILHALLSKEFDVIEAKDGAEGIKQLEEHYQDLAIILLDLYMPVCDGFEFMRRKRLDERYDSIPTFVVTASGESSDEIACLELGANDFVVKPYNPEIMMNRIHNMIKLRESAALVSQLSHDVVTGLYSKEYFGRVVEETFASDEGAAFDLICSDIVNFRVLNGRYGDRNCDLLLHELASSLVEAIPGRIAAGRIGEGTFAFLIEHQERGWEGKLDSAVAKVPFANLNVRFGIVENVDHSMPVARLYSHATSAMETAKSLHGNVVVYFDDDLHQRQVMEQTIRESMEAALDELQFKVHFQPKCDEHTGKTGGAEALARWTHPELGIVSPALFIPIFERNGFITKLDLFVWEEACKEVVRCAELGLPVVPVSANASRLDFDLPDLADQLAAIADKHGVDHSLLHVELTETAYSDNPEAVTQTMHRLRELGFAIELDDFGSGYSSLVSLNTLPLDIIKLDMSMVQQATALHDFRIVESVIKLAQTLGLKTVVEGVETAEEAAKVRTMGCDYIQGYYYSKPLVREDFERHLAAEQAERS